MHNSLEFIMAAKYTVDLIHVYSSHCPYLLIGRAGASPPSGTTGAQFMYIHVHVYSRRLVLPSTMCVGTLQANVKPAH